MHARNQRPKGLQGVKFHMAVKDVDAEQTAGHNAPEEEEEDTAYASPDEIESPAGMDSPENMASPNHSQLSLPQTPGPVHEVYCLGCRVSERGRLEK